uniref:7TM_GPCR_Srx domain-containing protein n=1 Tax=Heligmosomoides polygyrus TaxID=6339 RepID=A0A183GQ29_HELPZ
LLVFTAILQYFLIIHDSIWLERYPYRLQSNRTYGNRVTTNDTMERSTYKAVTSKCIDFVPLAPVAFTWIMELHAIVYSIGIDDFYMLVSSPKRHTFTCLYYTSLNLSTSPVSPVS